MSHERLEASLRETDSRRFPVAPGLRRAYALRRRPALSRGRPASEMEPERRLDPNSLGDHLDRLYRAAWALCGSRETAEDLVQDTFARVIARPRWVRRDQDLAYLI